MKFQGRELNALQLWSKYVDFPENIPSGSVFLPLVKCPNPEHDTLKRHFQISVDPNDPYVHCFAFCGISGSYEHAICVIEGLYEKFGVERAPNLRERRRRRDRARRQARKIILRETRGKGKFKPQRKRTAKPSVDARSLEYATFIPQKGLEFLESRGISSESIAQWQIGWDSDDLRIVIPALDERGVLRFLIKRTVKNRRLKYLYTEGIPKTSLLFGACAVDMDVVRSRGLILTEGSLDVIRLHQHGFNNAVAILGTGISERQVKILAGLRPKRIFLMFDRDVSGVKNIQIAARELKKYSLLVCRYPKGKSDPAELTRREAEKSIERAVPAITWLNQNFPNVRQRREFVSG
jgi:DNA primase